MYTPPYNRVENRAEIVAMMRAHNFCLLVTGAGGELHGTHLPCLVDERDGQLVVELHMAKANPQWQQFFDDEVLLVFSGPHAYISPRWYEGGPAVPTWNYAAVHAYGTVTMLDARDVKHAAQRRLVAAHDPEWSDAFDRLSRDYVDGMLSNIVSFEVAVTRIDARWKLSQNRGRRDQERVIENLERNGTAGDQALAALMRRHRV
ncbi:MAG TPA: FMN-binding negative transcriptional regulator [Burkholderiales bacterium]|nr:FMN-binding negative transcriptional regulator [Burkholderiales bacterium]